MSELEKLQDLLDSGFINEEEFQLRKSQLVDKGEKKENVEENIEENAEENANIRTMIDMTQLTAELCRDILRQNNNNLEQAINSWLGGEENLDEFIEPEEDEPKQKTVPKRIVNGSPSKWIEIIMILKEFRATEERLPIEIILLITSTYYSLFKGRTTTICGLSGPGGKVDGDVSIATMNYPMSICVDPDKNIIFTDYTEMNVRRLSSNRKTLITLAGEGGAQGFVNAIGKEARFHNPIGICSNNIGEVFVCDYGNNQIRKVAHDGTVTSYPPNTANVAGYEDGAEAKFSGPYGVCFDLEGNLLVADCQNHKIRKIDSKTHEVTTIAGSSNGWQDGVGRDAQFGCPVCLAVEPNGNILVSDFNMSKIRRIIMPEGRVTTLAGTDSGYQDGPSSEGMLKNPVGICIVGDSLIVADYGNFAIRRVSLKDGEISTVCGADKGDVDGDEEETRFSAPIGVCNYGPGVVLVTDASNHKIKKLFV